MLMESSVLTNEIIWELPLFEEYKEMLKSSIADISNLSSPARQAGSITAALFLSEFVNPEF